MVPSVISRSWLGRWQSWPGVSPTCWSSKGASHSTAPSRSWTTPNLPSTYSTTSRVGGSPASGQQVSQRGGESPDTIAACQIGISVVDRTGQALGFATDVGDHRVALSLTGVDHRPFASVDRLGRSAMSVHATGVIGAAFASVVSADRRQSFVEELKLVMETRDWDTELD